MPIHSKGYDYLMVDNVGRVFSNMGPPPSWGASFSTSNSLPPNWLQGGEQVVSLSLEPWSDGTQGGGWVFSSQGRVVPFGDAHSFGDLSNVRLNGPIVGSIATPTGHGYYMVGSDGGIFSFGSAVFRGSMGGTRLNRPITGGIAYGDGYLFVASDGGTFDFSTQAFYGSMGSNPPPVPVVSIASYP